MGVPVAEKRRCRPNIHVTFRDRNQLDLELILKIESYKIIIFLFENIFLAKQPLNIARFSKF